MDRFSIFILYIIIILFDNIYVYEQYPLLHCWNTDQVPLPFASKPRRVLDFKGAKRVWVSTPSPGLLKRQCSLFLTIRADGKSYLF